MSNPDPDPPTAVAAGPLDAYPPAEIAKLVEGMGVKKANILLVQTLALGDGALAATKIEIVQGNGRTATPWQTAGA